MRLAWFTPLAPVRSGIAAYSEEILPELGQDHAIDVFVEDAVWSWWARRPAERFRVERAHEFIFLHDRDPFDLVVYQLGNATCHDYMWPYLLRFPGLVVLHDGQFHHARARDLLGHGRRRDYEAEFAWNHPSAPPTAARFVSSGLQGAPYYFWPMLRAVLARARGVAVHAPWLRDTVQTASPVPVHRLRMGVAAVPAPAGTDCPARDGPLTLAAFGHLTPEKRLEPLLRAFAAVRTRVPPTRLLLAGARAAHFDIERLVAELGLHDATTVTDYVPDALLPGLLREADVVASLRWPTSRETSASWLRALAAGRPTIITDLVHTTDVPALDPRSWTLVDGEPEAVTADGGFCRRAPVAVAIDILDEAHSLRLALVRLLGDDGVRQSLGKAAEAYWRANHTLACLSADYACALAAAAAAPVAEPPADWPAHLLADGTALARALVAECGATLDF